MIGQAKISAVCALAVGLSGCAAPARASLVELQTRAAFDLSCAPTQLRLYHLSERTKGVFGCNRRLTYLEVCDTRYGSRCSWLLDAPPAEPTRVLYQVPNSTQPVAPPVSRGAAAPAPSPAPRPGGFDPGF